MAKDLTGRVIVITGASSGIGAATAVACARAGMDVVLTARRAERLRRVADEINRIGGQAEIVVGDVTDKGFSKALLDAADDRFGRFDAVFANAGYGFEMPTVLMDEDKLRRIFEVNFFSAVDLIQLAAGRLLDRAQLGHLLMCSSCLAKFTMPNYAAYSATKSAQNHFCRALRLELAPDRIEVTSVHPITTTTEFTRVAARESGAEPPESGIPGHAPKMFVQSPERVARAVVRCLRKPRPEVWTSHIVRFSAALMTMFPGLLDLAMRGEAKRGRTALAERTKSKRSNNGTDTHP